MLEGSLPPGVEFDPITGRIHGAPTQITTETSVVVLSSANEFKKSAEVVVEFTVVSDLSLILRNKHPQESELILSRFPNIAGFTEWYSGLHEAEREQTLDQLLKEDFQISLVFIRANIRKTLRGLLNPTVNPVEFIPDLVIQRIL